MLPKLVISLDYELFWGVADWAKIDNKKKIIERELETIPKILNLFNKYKIHTTWAVVGMTMCENYEEWLSLKPKKLPIYENSIKNKKLERDILNNQHLFFSKKTINQILETPNQEIGSHSYSHICSSDKLSSTELFEYDLDCAIRIADNYNVKLESFVFPRNQVRKKYIDVLDKKGFKFFRGNPNHWLYRQGHNVQFGKIGRLCRLCDSFIPISNYENHKLTNSSISNIPADFQLRRYIKYTSRITENLNLLRIKNLAFEAVKNNGIFHLWFHPQDIGEYPEKKLNQLETLLKYFTLLRDEYGLMSSSMKNVFDN